MTSPRRIRFLLTARARGFHPPPFPLGAGHGQRPEHETRLASADRRAANLARWSRAGGGARQAGRGHRSLKSLGAMTPDERRAGAAHHGLAKRSPRDCHRKARWKAPSLSGGWRPRRSTCPARRRRRTGFGPPGQPVMDELAEIFAISAFRSRRHRDRGRLRTHRAQYRRSHPARAMHDTFYFDRKDAEGGRCSKDPHFAGGRSAPCRARSADLHYRAGTDLPFDSDATHKPMSTSRRLVSTRGLRSATSNGSGNLPQGLFRARRHRASPSPQLFPVTEPSSSRRRLHDRNGRRVLAAATIDGLLGSGW